MKISRFSLLLVAALAVPVVPFVVVGELPGDRWLSAADDNALLFGVFGSGLLAADILLPVPSSILGTLLGARLGFIEGVIWCWLGLMLGNLVGYGAGRLALGFLADGDDNIPALSPVVLFITRPVPVLAEAMTFTAGAARMGMRSFLSAVVAGNAVYAVVLTGNGALLLPEALVGPGLVVPLLVPAAGWWWWRRRFSQRELVQNGKNPVRP